MRKNNHNLVNWQEGMGVNHTHFQQTENYFIHRLGDSLATHLTSYNYGLLPLPNHQKNSGEFDISEQITGRVEIKLRGCNAITKGGCRIAYNPDNSEQILYTHSFEETDAGQNNDVNYWDVILSINPFERIPNGIPDEEENPPRHPDVIERYQLSVVSQGKINYEQSGMYHLIIGRIRQYDGRYEVDDSYIPPCTSMNSHPELIKYYENFSRHLNHIEKASKDIIAKIRNREQNSASAIYIGAICEDMMRYISTIYFSYRNTGREAAPVEIVNYFSTLAHVCYAGLNFINKTDREELLKYFYEWSDVTPGSFEEMLTSTLSLIYDHNSIRSMMLQVETFLSITAELWMRLNTLEYVGQHKENIVISERSYQEEAKKKEARSWTILD